MFYDLTVDYGGVNFPKPYKQQDTLYIGFIAVFAGCNRAINGNPCPDCQNSSLWNPRCKSRFDSIKDIATFVRKKTSIFDSISSGKPVKYFYAVLGGEPLDQDADDLRTIHRSVREGLNRSFQSVLFTGYSSLNQVGINEDAKRYVLDQINYIKVGSYLGDSYKVDNLESGLATANQYWVIANPV